jgi:hypothetical protein
MYLDEMNKLTCILDGFGDILWITRSYYGTVTLMSACQLSASRSDLQGTQSAVALSIDSLTPGAGGAQTTSHGTLSSGKALTTVSATKPERAAKRQKRIVIKLRIGKLWVIGSSALWFEAVTGHIYTFRQSGQCTTSTNGESMLWVLAGPGSVKCQVSTVTQLLPLCRTLIHSDQ